MDLNQSFSQFNRLNKDNLDNNKQFLMDNSKAFNNPTLLNMLVDSEVKNLEYHSKFTSASDLLKKLHKGIQPKVSFLGIHVSGTEKVSGVYQAINIDIFEDTMFSDCIIWFNKVKYIYLVLYQSPFETKDDNLKMMNNKVFLTTQDFSKKINSLKEDKVLYQTSWIVKSKKYKSFVGNRKIEYDKIDRILENKWSDGKSAVDIKSKVIYEGEDLVIPTNINKFSNINLRFEIKVKINQANNLKNLGGTYYPYKMINNRPSYIKEQPRENNMTGVSFGIFFDNRYNGWVFAKLNLKTLQNEDPFMRVVYYSPLKTYTIPSVFYCCKTNNYGLSEYIKDNGTTSELFIKTSNLLHVKQISRRSGGVYSGGSSSSSSNNNYSENNGSESEPEPYPDEVDEYLGLAGNSNLVHLPIPPSTPPQASSPIVEPGAPMGVRQRARIFDRASTRTPTPPPPPPSYQSTQQRPRQLESELQEGATVADRVGELTREHARSRQVLSEMNDTELLGIMRQYGLNSTPFYSRWHRTQAEQELYDAIEMEQHMMEQMIDSSGPEEGEILDDESDDTRVVTLDQILLDYDRYKTLPMVKKIISLSDEEIVNYIEKGGLRDRLIEIVHLRTIGTDRPYTIEQLTSYPNVSMVQILEDVMKVNLLFEILNKNTGDGMYDFNLVLDYQMDYYFNINKKPLNIGAKWYEHKINRPEAVGYLTEDQSQYYLFKQYIERVTRIKDMSGLSLVENIEDVIDLFFTSNSIESLEFNDRGIDETGVRPGFFRDMMEEIKEIFFSSFLDLSHKGKGPCFSNLNLNPKNNTIKRMSEQLNIKTSDLFKLVGATIARVLLVDNGATLKRHLFCDLKLCNYLLARMCGEEFNLDPNPSWNKIFAMLKMDSKDDFMKYQRILFKSSSEDLKMVELSNDIKQQLGMESSVKKNKTPEELEEIAAKEKELKELRKIKSQLEKMRAEGTKKTSDGTAVLQEIIRLQQEISKLNISLMDSSSESDISINKYLNNDNKLAFCYLDIMSMYEEERHEAIYNFCRGFQLVMSKSMYKDSHTNTLVTPKDLSILLEGEPATIEEIIKMTSFEESNSIISGDDLLRVERLFYEVLRELKNDKEFIEKLMIFWTNQKTLTNNKLKVIILRHKDGEANLPTSATCFFKLKLYNYPGDDETFKDTLRNKLRTSALGASKEIFNGGGSKKHKRTNKNNKNKNNKNKKNTQMRKTSRKRNKLLK